MGRYMLSVPAAEGAPPRSREQMAKVYRDVAAFNTEIQAAGAWVFAAGLHPPSTATVVRAQAEGEVLITDGPFAEGKEHIGGFWVIRAPDLDAALAWARKASAACGDAVEVRPMEDEPE